MSTPLKTRLFRKLSMIFLFTICFSLVLPPNRFKSSLYAKKPDKTAFLKSSGALPGVILMASLSIWGCCFNVGFDDTGFAIPLAFAASFAVLIRVVVSAT
eukprot:NODE_252_length_11723_cov_1.965933.p13 type:complete len:100 gc:universal NODE_252_length_11723_cov_1.965933:9218-8919(-)